MEISWLTFEVQVAGAIGVLCDSARVDLQRVDVVSVAGHNDVVPLVVVHWLVRIPLHQRWPIAQVENVVDVPRGWPEQKESEKKERKKFNSINSTFEPKENTGSRWLTSASQAAPC